MAEEKGECSESRTAIGQRPEPAYVNLELTFESVDVVEKRINELENEIYSKIEELHEMSYVETDYDLDGRILTKVEVIEAKIVDEYIPLKILLSRMKDDEEQVNEAEEDEGDDGYRSLMDYDSEYKSLKEFIRSDLEWNEDVVPSDILEDYPDLKVRTRKESKLPLDDDRKDRIIED